jgi:nucleotide-binding universal stress UspA family protein
MSLLTRRRGFSREVLSARSSTDRPVLLATLDVPFAEEAIAFAVDAAVESGHRLVLVNAAEVLLTPSTMVGYGYIERRELQDELRKPAELAASLAVPVERLRLCSPHPVDALVDTVAERNPSVLVFGPDPSQLRPRTYRRAARRILERVTCLVWLAE